MIYFDPIEFIKNRLKCVNIRFYNNDITKNVKSFVMKYLTKDEQTAFFNVIKDYKIRLEKAKEEDENLSNKEILNDYKQAKNLLGDMLVYNEVLDIKEKFKDQYFIWLPSSASKPRHQHMLYYGKKFSIEKGVDGKGTLPGMDWGCQCGMLILTEAENKRYKNYSSIPSKLKIKKF